MMQWLKDFQASATKTLAQYNNSAFKEATMAACALVAAADGTIAPEEKSKVAGLIQKNEMLQVFNATELRDLFLKYCDLATDEFSRLDLLSVVRRLRGRDGADTALKVALIIANADGTFDDKEKAVVKELCEALSVPSANYV